MAVIGKWVACLASWMQKAQIAKSCGAGFWVGGMEGSDIVVIMESRGRAGFAPVWQGRRGRRKRSCMDGWMDGWMDARLVRGLP